MAQTLLLEEHPICIGARGQWTHGAEPLHPRVAALFARNLVAAADGSYEVVLGPARSPVQVADTAYFVRTTRLRCDARGELTGVELALSDGTYEQLDAASLMQADDGALYCRIVRDQLRVAARFKPADYHELALYCRAGASGAVLQLRGKAYSIGPYMRLPLPR